jgi:hypothetical protein
MRPSSVCSCNWSSNGQTTTLESYSNLSVCHHRSAICGYGDRQRLELHHFSKSAHPPPSLPPRLSPSAWGGDQRRVHSRWTATLSIPRTPPGSFLATLNLDHRQRPTIPWLDPLPIFNLVCIPGESDAPTLEIFQAYCALRRAFLIIDAPQTEHHLRIDDIGAGGQRRHGIFRPVSE